MKETIVVCAAVAALVAFHTGDASPAQSAPMRRMVPCVYEDGSGGPLPCYWDGDVRGNGTGTSYWFDTRGRQHHMVTPWRHGRAGR